MRDLVDRARDHRDGPGPMQVVAIYRDGETSPPIDVRGPILEGGVKP